MIKIYGKIFAVGTTFKLTEKNGYSDSDFYASYLDFNTHSVKTEEYATTRFSAPKSDYDAFIDLTKENLIKWWKEGGKDNVFSSFYAEEKINSKKPTKDKFVKIVRGKKDLIGKEGTIFWLKDVNYDPYKRKYNWKTKIGIRDNNNNVYWTYVNNVEVLNPDTYINIDLLNKKVQNWYDEVFKIAI